MQTAYDAAQAWRMQRCLDLRWGKAVACCVKNRREAVVEGGREALQQKSAHVLRDKLDAMTAHASRVALTAYGATSGRVVGKRTTRHVSRSRSRGGG